MTNRRNGGKHRSRMGSRVRAIEILTFIGICIQNNSEMLANYLFANLMHDWEWLTGEIWTINWQLTHSRCKANLLGDFFLSLSCIHFVGLVWRSQRISYSICFSRQNATPRRLHRNWFSSQFNCNRNPIRNFSDDWIIALSPQSALHRIGLGLEFNWFSTLHQFSRSTSKVLLVFLVWFGPEMLSKVSSISMALPVIVRLGRILVVVLSFDCRKYDSDLSHNDIQSMRCWHLR